MLNTAETNPFWSLIVKHFNSNTTTSCVSKYIDIIILPMMNKVHLLLNSLSRNADTCTLKKVGCSNTTVQLSNILITHWALLCYWNLIILKTTFFKVFFAMSLTIEDNRTFFSDPINPIYACVMYIIHSFEIVNYFTYEKKTCFHKIIDIYKTHSGL